MKFKLIIIDNIKGEAHHRESPDIEVLNNVLKSYIEGKSVLDLDISIKPVEEGVKDDN